MSDFKNRVLRIISAHESASGKTVTENTTLADMGLDSLDRVEILMALEDEFNIEILDAEAHSIANARGLVTLVEAKAPQKNA